MWPFSLLFTSLSIKSFENLALCRVTFAETLTNCLKSIHSRGRASGDMFPLVSIFCDACCCRETFLIRSLSFQAGEDRMKSAIAILATMLLLPRLVMNHPLGQQREGRTRSRKQPSESGRCFPKICREGCQSHLCQPKQCMAHARHSIYGTPKCWPV